MRNISLNEMSNEKKSLSAGLPSGIKGGGGKYFISYQQKYLLSMSAKETLHPE
ncbi:MAG TPA: hypothetical protein PLR88_10085 [Bacteroidales bacterium]|nr:hypothetical protein [Bacteroidales bacterium]